MKKIAHKLINTALRSVYQISLLGVVAFLMLPSVVVFLLSFSGESFIQFPPPTWGLRQYVTFFTSEEWLVPLSRSIILGAFVAVIAVLVGSTAVIALARSRLPGRNLIQIISLGPLIIPAITYAIAVYSLMARLRLIDRLPGLVIAHTMLTLPYVILIVGSSINRIPQELELAAMSLGASRWRAYLDVTIPLLVPALFASLIFAFVTSFDEVVMASFLSGRTYLTLPKAIFDSVRYGVDAVITAIATLLTVATAILLVFATELRRKVA